MNELKRTYEESKLSNIPIPELNDAHEEEMQQDEEKDLCERFNPEYNLTTQDNNITPASSTSSASSTGTIIPSQNSKLFARTQGFPNIRAIDQIPWTNYFERELFFESKNTSAMITHHAYLTSPVGTGPLFVTHHGAGSSGLSFALLSVEIRKQLPFAGILSLDARGHGSTDISTPQKKMDLSLETLSADLLTVIEKTRNQMNWKELPPVVLIGHSLGGAVVTQLAYTGKLGNSLLGYVVLDVVEGSAIEALQSMQTYLSTRPADFPTLQSGIDWHIRSRTIRNSVSARTSVPALLRYEEGLNNTGTWTWKTDLAATQPFWEGWFIGLSKKFLGGRGGKLLILAGTDRLDKDLMIGQMQGKYALQVFPEAGHFIHEDLPEKTAMVVVDFYKRNDNSALVLPPKVSDLLRLGKKV